jgi:PAS domain S-box-containing protein
VPAALLAAALRAHSDGVAIARCRGRGRELRLLFVNESLCTMIGRDAGDIIGGPQGVLHADDADVRRLREWLGAARPGEPLTGEGLIRRGDGSTFSASWSFDPLFNRRYRLTHIVATYRDQTERRRIQEDLVHAQRLDAVGRLAGGVAHDFNNLISVINGYCEMLAARVATNPQAMREVAEIHHAGRKAAALTQQLLAFSRRQPFHARALNLNTLIEENAAILRRLVGDAGRIDFELAADLPNTRTDPAQFQQVLLNLVLNARDAMPAGGPIRIEAVPEPGGLVAVRVHDSGTGMSPEIMARVLEPFFTTKPPGKGAGMGLSMALGFARQSGGELTLGDAPEGGLLATLLLPAAVARTAERGADRASEPLGEALDVLAVEDDEAVRAATAAMLKSLGVSAVCVPTAAEALAMLSAGFHFDLLFSDVVLGGPMDGLTLSREARRLQPDLAVLLTTGYAEALIETADAPDQPAILPKPYAPSTLRAAIAGALAGRRAQPA